MASLTASTFTGVRVAHDRAATRRATIDTAVVARRTKASAPSKKGAFKVRTRPRSMANATMRVSFLSRSIERAMGRAIDGVGCVDDARGTRDIDGRRANRERDDARLTCWFVRASANDGRMDAGGAVRIVGAAGPVSGIRNLPGRW
jgi:hypothetical protein